MKSSDTWEMMVSLVSYDQLPDDELMEDCGWVLDKAHDDLDNFQFGLTRKIINKAAARSALKICGVNYVHHTN